MFKKAKSCLAWHQSPNNQSMQAHVEQAWRLQSLV